MTPITSINSDKNALTLTVIGEYPVPVDRLWQAYTDPRQIEKFWEMRQWQKSLLDLQTRLSTFRV